jgi:Ca-activated chloride channel homolog
MVKYPDSAYLFLLFIPLLWSIFHQLYRGRKVFSRIKGNRSAQSLHDFFLVKWFFSSLSLALFLLFLLLGLLGFPGTKIESYPESVKQDVIFAVDISQSMRVGDVEPDRLSRVVSLIKSVLDDSGNSRYGLLVFTHRGLMMIPVSEDLQALSFAVESLDPSLMSDSGTNLEEGLKRLSNAYPEGENRKRIALLFSDGEHHRGEPVRITERLKRERIKLHVVALGTEEGGEVPGPEGEALRDENGEVVISRLNTLVLQALAEAAGGEYLRGGRVETLDKLQEILGGGGENVRMEQEVLYRPFLAIALFFLFFHGAVRMIPWRKNH